MNRERERKIIGLLKFFPRLASGHGGMHGFCKAGCRPFRDAATGEVDWPEQHFRDKEKEVEKYL